jgi:Fe-Mn family superoxide dismutase
MAYPHILPELGFDYNALEPHLDARTMEIHLTKHHNAYVTNLNNALKDRPELHSHSVDALLRGISEIPEAIRGAVRNHGGGHHNHSLFWKMLAPGGASAPSGELASAIDSSFGSFDSLREKVTAAAAGQFGSGWGWLVVDPSGSLQVVASPNQDSPLMNGATPILGIDVWEHAYYLNYQNRRPDYLAAIWNVVNWDAVGTNYSSAGKK